MTFRGFCLVLALALTTPGAQAQTAKTAPVEVQLNGAESNDQIDKIIAAAGKGGRQVVVKVAPPAEAQAAADAPDEGRSLFRLVESGITLGLSALPATTAIPATLSAFVAKNENQLNSRTLMLAVLTLAIGLAAGWLAARGLRRLLPDRSMEREATLKARIVEAGKRALVEAAGALVFLKVTHVSLHLLMADAPLAQTLCRLVFAIVLTGLFYIIGARVLLRPFRSGHTLVPLPNADKQFPLLVGYGLIGPMVSLGSTFIRSSGGTITELDGWFMVMSTIVLVYKAWFFIQARHDIAALIRIGAPDPAHVHPVRQFMATSAGPMFAAVAVLIWLMGRIAAVTPRGSNWGAAAGLTQFYMVLTPLFVAGLSGLLREWLARQTTDATSPMHNALKETGVTALASVLWVLAILDLGRLWTNFLTAAVGEAGLNLLRGVVTAAVTGIFGLLVWVFLRRVFEQYAPRQRSALPGEEEEPDDAEPTIQSRLSSVLPVLKGLALALVTALTLLIVLSRLGIDTGPLLAGFGIMGLALSFGSQALVRDVVSGIFFLADDAFRVGEYIDTGRLKGTVERITLRSVQLRHQSGLVHTIPYGQLQSVTNASRDWATVKFQIRLDHKADIEKTRKIIKKIGQEMLTHPEFGEDFFLPVKFQGIQEIQDTALVARVKFTAKPFRTSQIQREALKRIYIGLTEAGVPLATSSVTVRGGSPEVAAAAFVAAHAPAPAV